MTASQTLAQRGIGIIGGIIAGVAGLLVILVIAIGIAISSIDIESYRPQIAEQASAVLDREVALDGEMSLGISLSPRIAISDVSVANAPWGQADHLLSAERLELSLALLPLLSQSVEVKSALLRGVDLNLEQNDDGEVNWALGSEPAAPPQQGQTALDLAVDEIRLERVALNYRVPEAEPFALALDRGTLTAPKGEPAKVRADGKLQGSDFALNIETGSLAAVQSGERFPVEVALEIADHVIELAGEASQAGSFDGRFSLSTDRSAASLAPLLDGELPPIGPYSLSSDAALSAQRVDLTNIEATIDGNTITGGIAADLSGTKPVATVKLRSDQFDLAVLMPEGNGASTESEESAEPTASGGPMIDPAIELPVEPLRSADLDFTLDIARLLINGAEATDTAVELTVQDGLLHLKRAYSALGDGVIDADMQLDGSAERPKLSLSLVVDAVDYGQLLDQMDMTQQITGTLDGSVSLKSGGATVGDVLAGLNGAFALSSQDGTVAADSFGKWFQDLLSIMVPDMARGEPQPFNCAFTRWSVEQGLAETEDLIIDTPRFTMAGVGGINFPEQTVDLVFRPRVKADVPWQDAAAVRLSGPWTDVKASPDVASLARGAAQMLLGEGNPLNLVIPEVEDSGSGDNPCLRAVQQEQDGEASDDAPANGSEGTIIDRARGVLEGIRNR